MTASLKKRGQKIIRRFSRASIKASEEGKEHIKENFIDRLSLVKNIKLLIFEWSLLILTLITLSIAQAFWFGNSYSENVFVAGGTYTEGTIGKVNSMNPLFATTSSEKTLSRLLFATLVTTDYSGHLGAGLAKEPVSQDDGHIWIIELKEGLKWSDGEPITVDDVMFTISLIQNPNVDSIYSPSLKSVRVTQNQANKITFTLPADYADFESVLTIPVVPKHILENADPKVLIEHDFSTNPVGSGAFMFKTTQTFGGTTSTMVSDEKLIYLSANPNYYLGKPMLNTFAVHTFNDKAELIENINNGTITATADLSPTDEEEITLPQIYKRESGINSGIFAIFNMDNVKNREVRAAIRLGLDKGALTTIAPNNTVIDYPLLQSQIELNNYPAMPAQDFQTAFNKVTELSGENPINLSVVTVNSGLLPKIAENVTEQLKNLGFNAHLATYEESPEFISSTIAKRGYDILIYEIELGSDPDLLPYYHSSQANESGLNLSNYRNLLVDDFLLAARKTLDKDMRIKKYESFLESWATDIPAIALFKSNITYYYNKNVRTFSDNTRLITPLDRFSDVHTWMVSKEARNRTP